MHSNKPLTRLDTARLRVENAQAIDVIVHANEQVPIEKAAVSELLSLLELNQTVKQFSQHSPESFGAIPKLKKVVVTPDFHKAQGVPVGTVLATQGFIVPQAIGNDINCGMRLHITSLTQEQVQDKLDDLETALRHLYFEAGRNIPMSGLQREALLTKGLAGLLEASPKTLQEGIWPLFHEIKLEDELKKVEQHGSLEATRALGLENFIRARDEFSRDTQIATIGGGNHFVEIQKVEAIIDPVTAYAWGLKEDLIAVMVHSGSRGIGHNSGAYYQELIRNIFPKSLKHPSNGIFVLPQGEQFSEQQKLFWDALHNAANFAFGNRFFLALVALAALKKVFGDLSFDLLYDSPHNFLWQERYKGENIVLHRKGATPARGFESMEGTPFAYYGEPVLVPGSMGSSSYVLAGQGNESALWSASHGAGRQLSRGKAKASKENDLAFQEFLDSFRVVTPVDFRRADIQMRKDIISKKLDDLKQEAPYAYKSIDPIIDTLTTAGIARPVAKMKPIMTVKD